MPSSSTAPARRTCRSSPRSGASGVTRAGAAWSTPCAACAPSWLAQLPALVEPHEQQTLAAAALGGTRERMLRELAELFEVATAERPLVLTIEDLHWSDRSTIEAIAYLARARRPARLLLLGTYRSAEVMRASIRCAP